MRLLSRLRRRGRRALIAAVTASVLSGGGLTAYLHAEDGRDTPSVPLAPAIGQLADLLNKVVTVPRISNAAGYERGCTKGLGCVFGPAWQDPHDRSGCDTRNRVLSRALTDVTYKPGTRNCKVIAGWRIDPYSGDTITLQDTEIDHIFPLHAAWNAGASQWDLQRRRAFANDLDNLEAVSGRANHAKGDKTPAQWMPSRQAERCPYVLRYLSVAVKYELPITIADRETAVKACPKGNAA